jgi:hypothetical protein
MLLIRLDLGKHLDFCAKAGSHFIDRLLGPPDIPNDDTKSLNGRKTMKPETKAAITGAATALILGQLLGAHATSCGF